MPLIIEHIDAIARAKKRGVLFVEFRRPEDENDGFRLATWPRAGKRYPSDSKSLTGSMRMAWLGRGARTLPT